MLSSAARRLLASSSSSTTAVSVALRHHGAVAAALVVGGRGFAAAAKDKTKTYKFKLEKEHQYHHCDPAASHEIETTKDELLGFYDTMYTMRRMEIAADQLYKQRLIRGFLHLYNGQEAVATGVLAGLNPDDAVVTAYRDHGFSLLRGGTVETILAELLGRATGVSHGKGGSMHLYDPKHHFYGGNAIVGAQVPMGAGIAFSNKYLNNGRVCVAAYGDGAANQGQIFEAFNMAQLWKLPCIFMVENNHYAMGTSVTRGAASSEFYKRGDFVAGIRADGMDVLSAKHAALYAAEHARTKGPIILEMMTYRYVGHSMSDPGTTYRTRAEVDEVRKKQDPIENLKETILSTKIATADEIKQIETSVKKIVDDALAAAQAAPEPELKELYTDIYKELVPVRTVERVNSFVPSA